MTATNTKERCDTCGGKLSVEWVNPQWAPATGTETCGECGTARHYRVTQDGRVEPSRGGTKDRLWAKLLAQPDDLTDLRIIFVEWVNTKAKLDDAEATPYTPPPVRHKFSTFEERQAYLKLVQYAQQGRKYIAALRETCDSLEGQLRMMAHDLPLETLDELLQEIGG